MKKLFIILFIVNLYADLTDLPNETSSMEINITQDNPISTITTSNGYNDEINNSFIDNTTGEIIYNQSDIDKNISPMDYGNQKTNEIYNNLKNIDTISKAKNVVNSFHYENKDFMSDPSKITQQYIREHSEENSTTITAFDALKNVRENAIANIIKKQDIVKCYITRKLVNAYYCPLSNRDDSYYVGGSTNEDKQNALNTCNQDCKNPVTILEKDSGYPIQEISEYNTNIYKDKTIEIPINAKLSVSNIVTSFNVNINKENIEVNDNGIINIPYSNYVLECNIIPDNNSFDIKFNQTEDSYYFLKILDDNLTLNNSLNENPIKIVKLPFKIDNSVSYKIDIISDNDFFVLKINGIPYISITLSILDKESNIKIENATVSDIKYYKPQKNIYIKFDILDANYTKYTQVKLKLNSSSVVVKNYMNIIENNKIYLKFYQPYKIDENNTITVLNNNFLTLNKITVNYKDNKYYFCSGQFVDNINECDGNVSVINIDGNSYNICSTKLPGQGPNYSYFTLSSAKAICYEKAECLPTYRYLTLSGEIPDWAYDVEVGCVDSDDNKLCTDEICKELYLSNESKILEEKTWYGDDKVVETIKGGDLINDRPRVDIETELSNNNDKQQMFIEEMKDIAFKHMVEDNKYSVSTDVISKDYPRQDSIKIINNDMDRNLIWYLKANSYAYDNNEYYIYVVLDIAEQYYNKTFQLLDERTNVYKDAIEVGVLDRDDSFVTINENGDFKLFRKQEFYKRKYPIYSSDGNITRLVWRDTNDLKSYNKFYQNGEWLAYSINDYAPYFKQIKFSTDNLYESFNIINNLYDMIKNTEGIVIHSQNKDGNNLEKKYDGDIDDTYKSYILKYKIYGIYSKEKLTYQDLINKINENNLIFDSDFADKYTNPIEGEGSINNNIKIYIYGKPENFSVNGVFNPDSTEEGEKAFIFMFLNDTK